MWPVLFTVGSLDWGVLFVSTMSVCIDLNTLNFALVLSISRDNDHNGAFRPSIIKKELAVLVKKYRVFFTFTMFGSEGSDASVLFEEEFKRICFPVQEEPTSQRY